eukprot:CAMPEP_0197049080 /NCGR_PEP_ID=MMETSP1384-20130603/24299_1 /TAXON_ID=29189 /ORGANISM="Ammonia sp." /LENGTH=108 /DNA_ID=CAMNT_0042481307 /DNA_START=518 /DNA_END=844 /DNA_ORIENTATION=+
MCTDRQSLMYNVTLTATDIPTGSRTTSQLIEIQLHVLVVRPLVFVQRILEILSAVDRTVQRMRTGIVGHTLQIVIVCVLKEHRVSNPFPVHGVFEIDHDRLTAFRGHE